MISLNGGFKYNFYERNVILEGSESITSLKGNGLGFIIGGSVNYPINKFFYFHSGINYEKTNNDIRKTWNSEEQKLVEADNMTYDLSGFRLNVGITYKF